MSITEEDWDSAAAAASARLSAMFEGYFRARDGEAQQTFWQCDDGWIVGYTTGRIVGGPYDGKFATFGYKPRGKGARSGDPENGWERVYYVKAATRKLAKQRAERLWDKHNSRKRGGLR